MNRWKSPVLVCLGIFALVTLWLVLRVPDKGKIGFLSGRGPDSGPLVAERPAAGAGAAASASGIPMQAPRVNPTAPPRSLVKWAGAARGRALAGVPEEHENRMQAGRERPLVMPDLASFAAGEVIEVALPDGRVLPATVNLSREDLPDTWVLAAGFGQDSGGLTLRQDKGCRALFGRIVRVGEAVA
jgi:hypothetical protein